MASAFEKRIYNSEIIFTPLDVPIRFAPERIIVRASSVVLMPPEAFTPILSPTAARIKETWRACTIGRDIEHLRRMTLEDVRSFFFSHYAPNNAVLAICGNVTLDEVRRKVEHWFGSIPSRAIASRSYVAEAPISSPRSLTVHRPCPSPRIAVAYPMGAYGSADFYEGDLLTDLLAAGRSSVFHGPLLRNNPVFARADASISAHEEPGYLLLTALLTDSSETAVAASPRPWRKWQRRMAPCPIGSRLGWKPSCWHPRR